MTNRTENPPPKKKLSIHLRSLLLRERDQLAFALDFAGIGVAFRHILKPGEIRGRFRGILVCQQRAGVPGAKHGRIYAHLLEKALPRGRSELA